MFPICIDCAFTKLEIFNSGLSFSSLQNPSLLWPLLFKLDLLRLAGPVYWVAAVFSRVFNPTKLFAKYLNIVEPAKNKHEQQVMI